MKDPVRTEGTGTRQRGHISVLIACGDPLNRAGLAAALDREDGIRVVGCAPHPHQLARHIRRGVPDVVVLPDDADLVPAAHAPAGCPVMPHIIAVAMSGDAERHREQARPAEHARVCGVTVNLAEPATLEPAVRLLGSGYQVAEAWPAAGRPTPGAAIRLRQAFNRLTWREIEVVHLMARGWTNAEIADVLMLSGATVKTHVHNVIGKLALSNRIDVITMAYAIGFVRPVFFPGAAGTSYALVGRPA